MTAYEYSKKDDERKLVIRILVGIPTIFFLIILYFMFIHGTAITKSEYWKAKFIVVTRQVIGLDYEQCCEKLYKEPPNYVGTAYRKLIKHKGKKDNYTPVDHSYYARFYVCSAFADNDLPSPYCYTVYFDEEQKAIYVELSVDPMSAVY